MPLRENSRSLPKSRARSIRAISAFATTGLLFGAFAATGSAATITVANTNDTGAGSLRQAVTDAASGDIITFGSGVEGTVTFTSGPIAIDKSLTITGSGPENVILRGAGDRLFRIGATNGAIDVTFQGLRLTFGKALADGGGALYSSQGTGQTLSINDSVVDRNVAGQTTAGGGGGAILLDGNAALVVSGSAFRDNASRYSGGAIRHASLSPITITNSNFARNVSDGSLDGGAISLDADVTGTPTGASLIEGTAFESNSGGDSGNGGGAIDMRTTSPLTIRDSRFASNTVKGRNGGAIRHYSTSALVVEDTTFTSNLAEDGGAIFSSSGSGAGGPLTIRESFFLNNFATQNGGALARGGGVVTISDTVFQGNYADDRGAAFRFFNAASALVTNSAIVQNTGGDNSASSGVHWASSGTLDMSNVTMAANVASAGAASALQVDSGTANLNSVTIAGNVTDAGPAVRVSGFGSGFLNVTNSIIAENQSVDGSGDCETAAGTRPITFAGGAGTSILGNSTGCNVQGDAPKTGDAGLGDLRRGATTTGNETWIVPLLATSPALDAGATALTTDQRGVARPQGPRPDIGAVEMRPAGLAVTMSAGQGPVGLSAPVDFSVVARNTGDFPISPASLAFGLPAPFLAFSGPATGATCAASSTGASCNLGTLVGEQEREVRVTATTKTAGSTTASATLSASGFANATASVPLTIVTGAGIQPAAGVCSRQIVRLRVKAPSRIAVLAERGTASEHHRRAVPQTTRRMARVSCRLALNNQGTYAFRFSKGQGKGNWAIVRGSTFVGKKTTRTRTTLTIKNTKAGRKIFLSALMPTQARSVPLSIRYTSAAGQVTPQTVK